MLMATLCCVCCAWGMAPFWAAAAKAVRICDPAVLEQLSYKSAVVNVQVCMSAASLFHRVRACSHVPRADHASPLAQLDAVGNFVADMQAALRELRGGAHQGPALKGAPLQGQAEGRPVNVQQIAAG